MTEETNNAQVRNSRIGVKKGWITVTPHPWKMNVHGRLLQMVQSPVIPDEAKAKAKHLLASIVDGRMPTKNFRAARALIKENRNRGLQSKKIIQRLTANYTANAHAVFMACQACDNLRDRTIEVVSGHERDAMIAQIASAINALSEVQSNLIEGNHND